MRVLFRAQQRSPNALIDHGSYRPRFIVDSGIGDQSAKLLQSTLHRRLLCCVVAARAQTIHSGSAKSCTISMHAWHNSNSCKPAKISIEAPGEISNTSSSLMVCFFSREIFIAAHDESRFDVVVVGFGVEGLSAAVADVEAGARVESGRAAGRERVGQYG